MKKIICFIICVILSNCQIEIKPREINAQSIYSGLVGYEYSEKVIHGMEYGIWTGNGGGGRAPAIFVVNLTKDELEVELLRKQLKK